MAMKIVEESSMFQRNRRLAGLSQSGHGVRLACLGVAGVLGLVAPGRALTATDKEAAAKGQITYVRYCVSCHGKEARGDGPLAADLRVPVPDLTLLAARSGGTYPYDRVVQVVTKGSAARGHGTDDMPAWGTAFNRTEGTGTAVDAAIRNLAHFLWSRQRPK